MFSYDIAERTSERMPTNPFFIFGMTFPDLIKKLQTSSNSGINRIYSQNNLCIREEISSFFCIGPSIANNADFLLMIQVDTVKNAVI